MAANQQLNIRVEPEIKKMISTLARKQGRTPSNLVKWLIRKEFEAEHTPAQSASFADRKPAQQQEPAAVL